MLARRQAGRLADALRRVHAALQQAKRERNEKAIAEQRRYRRA